MQERTLELTRSNEALQQFAWAASHDLQEPVRTVLAYSQWLGEAIGAGLGPGPRDGLMTGLAAKGFPLWAVRTVLELAALAAGWFLGGNVGVGTVAFAFSIGPLGHFFLAHLHLENVPADLGPGAVGE